MEPYLAEVRLFGGDFAPRGWAFCQGQLLSIAQNTALFSLLGTIYGGDGRTTFALPDLRGRAQMNPGTGPGLPTYRLGQQTGAETNTMNILDMPNHTHGAALDNANASIKIPALADAAGTTDPTGAIPASGEDSNGAEAKLYSSSDADTTLRSFTAPVSGSVTIDNTGGSQPMNNLQPYTGLNFIICTQGLFPSRS